MKYRKIENKNKKTQSKANPYTVRCYTQHNSEAENVPPSENVRTDKPYRICMIANND